MKKALFFNWLVIPLALGTAMLQAAPPITLNPENPHYFLFRDKPTVLIASTEHYGSVINPDFDYVTYLNEIASKKLNYTRTFAGSYVEYQGWFSIPNNTLAPASGRLLAPWARSSTPGYLNGGNKFDLSRFDDAYFARLRDFVSQASSRGIVVELSLFCNYYTVPLWQLSPFYEKNNINGIHGGGGDGALANSLNNGDLGAIQDAYVRKVVTELNARDNVVYEICNEDYDVKNPWLAHIADVITQTEASLPNKHLITQNIANGSKVVDQPNPEVSVFNFHYCRPPDAPGLNAKLPKVIGFDENGSDGSADIIYRQQGWNFLMAGGGLYDNLDYSFTVASPVGAKNQPTAPGGGSPELRTQLSVMLQFMNSLDFLHMAPDTTTITGGVPPGASVRVLSHPGQQYALFLQGPNGNNQASLVANLPAGAYLAEWVNTHTGTVDKSETFTHAGGSHTLTSPTYLDDIALRITATHGKDR